MDWLVGLRQLAKIVLDSCCIVFLEVDELLHFFLSTFHWQCLGGVASTCRLMMVRHMYSAHQPA